ncbi:MAG: TonB family protein [Saprospiraceae bacterium]
MTIKSFFLFASLGLAVTKSEAQTPFFYKNPNNAAALCADPQSKRPKQRRASRVEPVAPTDERVLLSPANMSAYIVANLQYPALAETNKIEGVVQAKILLSPEGLVANSEIVKGLGYGCDEAVLKLLADMPAWKPLSDRALELIIPVRFVLR